MPNLIKLQITIKVSVPRESSLRLEPWVHLILPGTDKVLGKAPCDKSGQAVINLSLPGNTPPALEAVVSPLSRLMPLNFVVTERVALSKWENKDGTWQVTENVTISRGFLKSIDWLEEEFLVTGHLRSKYTDPETDTLIVNPIRHANVKMFDVDKSSSTSPSACIPQKISCLPQKVSCLPQKACAPITTVFDCIPKTLCKPAIALCQPKIPEMCTPSGPIIPGDIWQYEVEYYRNIRDSGCCGAETTKEVQLRKLSSPAPVMKPLSSPSLKSMDLSSDLTALACNPYILNVALYNKTALGAEAETDDTGYFAITFKRKDFFEAVAGSTHTEDKDWDELPDLLFEARLWIDGEHRLIYSEKYSATRWNQGTCTHVDLYVNGKVPSCDPIDDLDVSQAEAFLFHGVGNVEPGWIATDGVIKSAPAATGLNEYVFGGGMDIMGQFKFEHVGKYYQVEYQRNGEGDWHPILGEQWYYSHYLGAGMWETKVKAPESFAGYPACYQIPDYTDINITGKNKLITWQSYKTDGSIPRYPNGLYHLRVRLLEKVGLNLQQVPGFNPDANILHLKIDNNWPLASIAPTLFIGDLAGSSLSIAAVAECGIISRGANRYLLVNFAAQDLENHFLRYQITVNRGADSPIIVPAAGLAAGVTTTPSLPGFHLSPTSYSFINPSDNFDNDYTAMYLGADPWLPWQSDSAGHLQPQPLKPCAYNFRLSVYDRVTNGYGQIHYSEHNMTLTILE